MKRILATVVFFAGLTATLGCQMRVARETKASGMEAVAESAQAVAAETVTSANEAKPPDGSEVEDAGEGEAVDAASGVSHVPGRGRNIVWDVGVIPPGHELRHRFTVANDDNRAWTVKRVSKSCACTYGEFSTATILPGRTSSLEVSVRAATKEGPLYQAIVVEFQEPKTPIVHLVIKGEISNALSALPRTLKFGRVFRGAEISRSFEFHNNSDHDVTLGTIEAPDWLRVEAEPMATKPMPRAPRQRWHMVVRADLARVKPGTTNAAIVVHELDGRLEPAWIPVSIHLNAVIESIPGQLTFKPVASGKTADRSFILALAPELGSVSEADLVVTHDFGKELSVDAPQKTDHNHFLIVGHFRPQRPPGKVRGELEIAIRDRDVAPAHVRVFGEVR